LRLRRQQNHPIWIQDSRRRLQEDERQFGHFHMMLFGMFHIVPPNADNLRRLRWRQQTDFRQWDGRLQPAIFSIRIAFNRTDFVLQQPAIAGRLIPGLVTDDAHGSLLTKILGIDF
jgi:hypothetical protein